MHLFEKELLTSVEDIEFSLSFDDISWSDFLLNPRRLRGSDFLMRWSQGVWSEKRLIHAINSTEQFYAIPYGPSGTAPTGSVREFEVYFEKLENAGLGKIKRPDLLIFKNSDVNWLNAELSKLGGVGELPFIEEKNLCHILSRTVVAIECENSLWKSKKMPGYGKELKPIKRLGGKLGLPKSTVVPTVIIKEEDLNPLLSWQKMNNILIHVWHVFFDQAIGLEFNKALSLISDGLILPTVQTFQAPGGATTKKNIYKFYYHYAYLLGESVEEPILVPDFVEDRNGHILPYVKFQGGMLSISDEALKVLKDISSCQQ